MTGRGPPGVVLASAAALLALPGVTMAQAVSRMDHHLHLNSPAIVAFLPRFCAAVAHLGGCDERFTRSHSIEELLAQMDAAGVQRGWLLSTGYLAQSGFMPEPMADAADIVHAANVFTVQTARTHPDRISAFVSVNPLSDTALNELTGWVGDDAVDGVKLHLTNANFDFRDPSQVARLAAVFDLAARAHWTIMIHMRTAAADYGARDVEIFLADVLPHAGETPVVIAHAAGWSGVDAQTLDALGAFADFMEQDPAGARRLYFDLSLGDERMETARLDALTFLMRRIGVDRFMLGSDWPFVDDIAANAATLRRAVPLTPAEWETVERATVSH